MFFLCSRLGPFRLYTVGKKSLIQIKQTIPNAIKNWYFYIRILIFEKFRRMAFSIAWNDFFDYFRFCYDKVNSNSDFFEETHPKMILKSQNETFWMMLPPLCRCSRVENSRGVCCVLPMPLCCSATTSLWCLLLHPKTSISRASETLARCALTFPAAFSFTAMSTFWLTYPRLQ